MNCLHGKQGIVFSVILCFCLSFFSCGQKPLGKDNASPAFNGWKTGMAKAIITPADSIWMAGYAARTEPGKDTLHDLWAKVFVIEDANGKKGVLVATDLIGFKKEITCRIKKQLKEKYGFSEEQVILNSSHTHSGPVLEGLLTDIYPESIYEDDRIASYTRNLENRIIVLVGEALESMQPSKVYFGNGVSRFQVNRRNNVERNIDFLTHLQGPNDYAVPVIKVTDLSGNMCAVLFGYACHPTVLSGSSWSGDYVGFAQIELERIYPGVQAMFFQGASGDQNPLPRRSVPLARQYGLTLAASVERAVEENMIELKPDLKMAYSCVDLPFGELPTRESLEKTMKESNVDYYKQWAKRMLTVFEKEGSFISSYPYPVQVWKMGDLPIIALGGEVVIEYAINMKREYGQNAFVMGYCNDVMGYIPSEIIIKEGGYEGETSQMAYGLPAKWSEKIESMIYTEVDKLMNAVESME
ncbi:MAG TPA: hypothetical protein DEQ30_14845 [Porphyromonadaceae bacterium]|nr:hypothetical protein [Porphyromonadaceae bacterium]